MKMTIYVPDDLRKRMKKYDDQVDWSPLACQAFIAKLAEIAAQKDQKTMKDVVDRLRASKLGSEGKAAAAWREAGKKWAERSAEWAELERLDEVPSDFWNAYAGTEPLAFLLVYKVVPKTEGEPEMALQFWQRHGVRGSAPDELGETPNEEELGWFAEGALHVYEKVNKEL